MWPRDPLNRSSRRPQECAVGPCKYFCTCVVSRVYHEKLCSLPMFLPGVVFWILSWTGPAWSCLETSSVPTPSYLHFIIAPGGRRKSEYWRLSAGSKNKLFTSEPNKNIWHFMFSFLRGAIIGNKRMNSRYSEISAAIPLREYHSSLVVSAPLDEHANTARAGVRTTYRWWTICCARSPARVTRYRLRLSGQKWNF